MAVQEVQQCGLCGLMTLTRNPHPDAGKPLTLLTIGAVWECIPCLQRGVNGWAEKAALRQKRIDELEEIEAMLRQDLERYIEEFGQRDERT